MSADEELPPVVAPVIADISGLIRGLQEAVTAIKAFAEEAKAEATAYLDARPAMSTLVGLEAAIEAFSADKPEATLYANPLPALTSIAAVNAALGELNRSSANAGINVASSLASAAALGALSRPLLDQYATLAGIANATAMKNKGDVISALVGAGVARDTSASSGGGGFLATLGKIFGGTNGQKALGVGAGAGFLGLAGAGSVLDFAGLSAAHVAMTGAGLAGSAVGGLLGGGLLGLGSLGVMGVGMGTDLAGIGQAAGDIKTVNTDLNSLSQAIALYGATSTQAAQAQAQLNYDLNSFSPIARGAVLAAAQTAQGFKTTFDAYTGMAEKVGAQIIQQAMLVGETFLPTIGKYAALNMGIIQKSLSGPGGLFSWMQNTGSTMMNLPGLGNTSIATGGMSIFQDLERQFTSELPTAMHMITQAIELFGKTVDVASRYTGGFLTSLDKFFTKWNGADFSRWAGDIGKLIGDFRIWEGLVKAVGSVIFNLFSNSQGTASSIVTTLTTMLNDLAAWEKSVAGKASIANLFTLHKQEIDEILQILPALFQGLGSVYLQAAPELTSALVAFVRDALLPFLKAVESIPGGSFALGLALLLKFGPLSGIMGGLAKVAWGPIAAGIRAIGVSIGVIDAVGAVAALAAFGATAAVVGTAIATFVGTYEGLNAIPHGAPLNLHPTTHLTPGAVAFIGAHNAGIPKTAGPPGDVGHPANIAPIVLPPPDPSKWQNFWTNISHWLWENWSTLDIDFRHWFGNIEKVADAVWQAVDRDTRHWWGDIWAALDGAWQRVDTDARHWFGDVESAVVGSWQRVDMDARHWWGDVEGFLVGTWQHIDTDARHWFGDLEQAVTGIWRTLDQTVRLIWGGLSSFLTGAWSAFKGTASTLWTGVQTAVLAVWHTLDSNVRQVWTGLKAFLSNAWTVFKTTASTLWGGVVSGITTAWDGLGAAATKVWATVSGIFTSGVNDIIGIINVFIKAIDIIPGVNIKGIGLVGAAPAAPAAGPAGPGTGGKSTAPTSVPGHPGKGSALAAGGITHGPSVLVGEGNSLWPEWVIPSDPAHRDRALGLVGSLLGHMKGMKQGGILGGIDSALGGLTSGLTGLFHTVAGAVLSPAITGAEDVMNAAMGHLPFPINDLGKMASTAIGTAIKNLATGTSAAGGAGPVGTGFAANQALGQQMAAALGWTGAQWAALNAVEMREAGWNPTAQNPHSAAYGIAQFINGAGEYSQYGGNSTTVAGQIQAMLNYIRGRYGTPEGALAHEQAFGWYDRGGWLPPGLSQALNTTGMPERVGGGDTTFHSHINVQTNADAGQIARENAWEMRRLLVGLVR